MLLYFKFNNFYSFLDEAEISFQLGKQATKSDYDFEIETTQDKLRLNKVMAVLGANGSGKTQALKGIGFIIWFMCDSIKHLTRDDEKIFFKQFINSKEISHFCLGFVLPNSKGVYEEYRYELSLSREQVYKEALYKKTSRQFSYIFIREYKNKQLVYKHKRFLNKSLVNSMLTNISLFSYARLFDNEITQSFIRNLKSFSTNVGMWGRIQTNQDNIPKVAELLYENVNFKNLAEKLLAEFDTGINKVTIKKIGSFNTETNEKEEMLIPFFEHKYGNKKFELSIFEESNGTQSAFCLLGLILPILNNGGVATIDELDNDLHPHLLPVILDLFRSKHSNPHNAQLIFSCHTPEVFNILNKHQIYLVEKYQQQSETWRLDEVEGVRNDDNLYAKYMAGAFDAVPNV